MAQIGIIERFLCWLLEYKDVLKKDESGKVVQLRRWFLIGRDDSDDELENRQERLCIHKLQRSDLDRKHPHTHPWPWWTIPVWNSYRDEQYDWDPTQENPFRSGPHYEDMTFGKFRRRGQNHLHRVILKDEKPCWTIVWMGKPDRRWGFVDETGKFIDKDEFLGINKDRM